MLTRKNAKNSLYFFLGYSCVTFNVCLFFSIHIAHLQYGKGTIIKKSPREQEIRLDAVCVNKGLISHSSHRKRAAM